jgi:hypothetical protein
MCKEYNGWTNYETWNIKLWMDNDEGVYKYWLRQASKAKDAYTLSQEIKEFYQENMPELRGMYADLMTSALDNANWREIAENLINDLEPEEEEETEE